MQLIARSYDMIELQQLRTELESRGMPVHVSDEFTYSIPGMPGAEQPRGLWVAEEDVVPARRVVADLIGADRLEADRNDPGATVPESLHSMNTDGKQPRPARETSRLGVALTVITVLAIVALTWG